MAARASLEIAQGVASWVRSELLVGSNIEAGEDVIAALLTDRVRNPKFAGPQHPLTKMAPEWAPYPQPVGRVHWNCEVTPGVGMAGDEAQLLSRQGGDRDIGLVQKGIWVRGGEQLELELWAFAQGQPARLRVGVRPAPSGLAAYAEAELVVDAPYWKRYTVPFAIPDGEASDDDGAELFIRLLGLGATWIDQVHLRPAGTFLREETAALIGQVSPALIRFPGGCLSSVYRWRHGIGPAQLRPSGKDPIWMGLINYDFSTDELLELCHVSGALPQISVAVGSGTPQDAADWAAHCRHWYEQRGIEPPPMYWQIGNEQWGDWEIGQTTPVAYADLLRQWVPAIRAAYPNARIIALGQGDGSRDLTARESDRVWREGVLCAADCFDVLSQQFYVVVTGEWDREPSAYLARIRSSAAHLIAGVEQAASEAQQHDPKRTVALTEWNLWTAATSHGSYVEPADGAHAVFVATVLHGLMRIGPGVELANHYSLLNWFGVLQVNGASAEATALATLLRWYRDALPGALVACSLGGDGASLDALCVESSSTRYTFVVNWSATDSCTLELPEGWTASGAATIAAATPQALAESRELPAGAGPFELPPVSVSRLVLERP